LKTYKSVSRKVETELVIRKSRFITRVFPIDREGEAEKLLAEIREAHKDATHNVFAWQVGITKTVQRCSDDGEPSGTAGRPVLEVIKQNDLVNVLVVVTRYFGGIKLGAGGLIRAYSQAAREGIEKAGIVEKALHVNYSVTVDYPLVGTVQPILQKRYKIADISYGEYVVFSVLVQEENTWEFEKDLMDASNGQIEIEKTGTCFFEV
jgi:uncharacterized YigZ family protein